MARVFTAVETALGRRVVIKVLEPELAAGMSARRFAREIRLAASLQQANIVPVLSTGSMEGLPYYTMPFVEGLSLRDRLTRDGPLPISEAVSVLRDVARALVYAHEHGVVHRDIKPENVLLSGDAAVVTDFGIAKAISAARTIEGTEQTTTATQAGMAIGTPAYMAPEQLAADPTTDHRADLYSFGCLAFELLTGATPFAGRPAHKLLAAHVSEAPAPVGAARPDCPEGIARLVMQCLEKDPDRRPQRAREILRALDHPADFEPRRHAWSFRRLSRRRVAAALAALGAIGVAAVSARARSGGEGAASSARSIAVLPFINVGGDSAQEYLAEGIADELATALGKVPGIRVVSRTASYRYRGQRDVDLQQVGQTLSAGYVLHGTLRRFADRLRVSAQLTSATDNRETWSDSYQPDATDLFTVPDEIARAIAAALQVRLTDRPGGAAAPRGPGTSDPEAFDLYLRGRFLLQRRGPGVRLAVENFERAIARDSTFARAHAGLSAALELLPYFAEVAPSSVHERAIAAARRALALDSSLAEAHTALGLAYQHAWQWERADVEHRRAVAVDPTDASAHVQYGRFLQYTGRPLEAKAEFERARALDPYSAVVSGWLANSYVMLGRRADALAEATRALQLDSTNAPAMIFAIRAFHEAGRSADARAIADRFPWRIMPWNGALAMSYALLGDRETAVRLVREMESQSPHGPKTNMSLAVGYLAIGDTARALDALERATDARESWPTDFSLSERIFDGVRRNPRFAAIVRRVGLDERIFTSPTGGRPQ